MEGRKHGKTENGNAKTNNSISRHDKLKEVQIRNYKNIRRKCGRLLN
jgi:hypothetical protein